MKKILTILSLFAILSLYLTVPCDAGEKNIFVKKSSAHKKVALTFDDGPHPIYTPRILDILEEYGVSATFFVIGQNVENYPEAAKRLLESDCEIGNHTYSHQNVGTMSYDQVTNEIRKTEEAIAKISNRKPSLFRPPEGSCGASLRQVSFDRGYDIILWSIDTKDWAHTPSGKITSTVLEKISDGDVILMHDYTSGGCPSCDALRAIIPKLLEDGYEFVTISELLYEE